MVAAYLFRSAKTGASASRECSSCEGFGSLVKRFSERTLGAESIPELHESSAIMKYRLLGKSGADSRKRVDTALCRSRR
jgi:hypothetical protein